MSAPASRADRATVSWAPLVAGLATLGIAFLYVVAKGETAPEDELYVAVITATFFAAAGALLTAAVSRRPTLDVVLAGTATGVLAVWGVLALMSIGILLLGAALLAAFATSQAAEALGPRGGRFAVGAAFAGAAFAAATVALGW